MPDDYLDLNRANWDARADVHVGPSGYRLDQVEDPSWVSRVVEFDRERLGDLAGAHGVHLQCHLGTDTLSLARLGARMTVRDAHPVLNTLVGVVVRDHHPDRDQQPWISGPGEATPALEFPYWEDDRGIQWCDEVSYTGEGAVAQPVSQEWNHALSEIVMAVLDAGLTPELLAEHDSLPWDALPRADGRRRARRVPALEPA